MCRCSWRLRIFLLTPSIADALPEPPQTPISQIATYGLRSSCGPGPQIANFGRRRFNSSRAAGENR